MNFVLPGLTPSSAGVIQAGAGTSRLKELQDIPGCEAEPVTWREYPVRSVMIANYKKNTHGAYHRHNRDAWMAGQRERRDAFHDADWVEYFMQPRIPEGPVHLIIGDSLVRVLAGGNLEFLGCSNAPDVGVASDAGNGERCTRSP